MNFCCLQLCTSVDPAKFGTMFTCELDFTVHAIPMYFSIDEIVEECDNTLGNMINGKITCKIRKWYF